MYFDDETQCFVVESPAAVAVGRKKFMINLNPYRNSHYQVLNRAKDEYKRMMHNEIADLPKMERVSLNYEVYVGDNRIHDGMNIVSITSKFFLDALVAYGKLKDDNMKIVCHEEWNYGGYDKGRARVMIYIRPL